MQPHVLKRICSLDKTIASTLCVVAGAIFLTNTMQYRDQGFGNKSSYGHIFASSFYQAGKRSGMNGLEPVLNLPHTSPLSTNQPTRYAYVFYAVEDQYACSALVNMARLKKFGLPSNVDLIVIAHDTVSTKMRKTAEVEFGALIYDTKSFGEEAHMGSPIGAHSGYYQHCFQKLMVFLLPDNVYRRVILMDADSLILRPPHHLFQLPDELPFALPKGYWLRPIEEKLTSWFMSVRPSRKVYITLQRRLQEIAEQGHRDIYDMDLFNLVYGNETTILPDIYGMLDSEFEENHHDHLGSLDEILEGKKGWAVHFTAGGKPWSRPRDEPGIQKFRPGSHIGYARLTLMWQEEAEVLCRT